MNGTLYSSEWFPDAAVGNREDPALCNQLGRALRPPFKGMVYPSEMPPVVDAGAHAAKLQILS